MGNQCQKCVVHCNSHKKYICFKVAMASMAAYGLLDIIQFDHHAVSMPAFTSADIVFCINEAPHRCNLEATTNRFTRRVSRSSLTTSRNIRGATSYPANTTYTNYGGSTSNTGHTKNPKQGTKKMATEGVQQG